jgi:hypothetical protein
VGSDATAFLLDLQANLDATLASGKPLVKGVVSGNLNLSELSGDLGLMGLEVGAGRIDGGTARIQAQAGAIGGLAIDGSLRDVDLRAATIQLSAVNGGVGANTAPLWIGSRTGAVTVTANASGGVSSDVVIASRTDVVVGNAGIQSSGDVSSGHRGQPERCADRWQRCHRQRRGANTIVSLIARRASEALGRRRVVCRSDRSRWMRRRCSTPAARSNWSLARAASASRRMHVLDTRTAAATSSGTLAGALRIAAGENVTISTLQSSKVAVIARGGSIIDGDASDDATPDIVADDLALDAGEDIGGSRKPGGVANGSGNALEISAARLAATAGMDLRLSETDNLNLDSLGITVARAAGYSDSNTLSIAGLLSRSGGDIVVSAGSSGTPAQLKLVQGSQIATSGAGALRLTAAGTGARIVLAGNVRCGHRRNAVGRHRDCGQARRATARHAWRYHRTRSPGPAHRRCGRQRRHRHDPARYLAWPAAHRG